MKLKRRLAFVGASVTIAIVVGVGVGIAVAGPEGPQATFGTIPEDAYDAQGGIDLDLVPDYVVVLDRVGVPVGYVAKSELFANPPDNAGQTVVDRAGQTVGRMVPGYGYVPAGRSLDEMTPFEVSTGSAPTG